MKISIVGLGYVGLPTALAFHDVGFNVTGVDISEEVLGSCNSKSAKALLRAFSSDLANDWPKDGRDLAETRPDVGQKSSEVVE